MTPDYDRLAREMAQQARRLLERRAEPAPHPGCRTRRVKDRARWIRPPWGTPYRAEIIDAAIALSQAYRRDSPRVPELEARLRTWCEAAGWPLEWEPWTCPTCGR